MLNTSSTISNLISPNVFKVPFELGCIYFKKQFSFLYKTVQNWNIVLARMDLSFLKLDFAIKIWVIFQIEWEMGKTWNPNKTKQNKTGEKCRSLIWFFTPPEPVCRIFFVKKKKKKNLDKWFLKPLSSTDKSPLILHGSIIPFYSLLFLHFFYLNSEKMELFGDIIFRSTLWKNRIKRDRWHFRFLALQKRNH